MKTVTIYPTAIKVSEGMTLDDLTVADGFEELLDFNTPFERCKEIMDAFKSKGIDMQVVVAPDGSTDENLISRDDIKKFLDASKSNIQYGIYFETPISEGAIFGSRAASEKSSGVCGSIPNRVIDL